MTGQVVEEDEALPPEDDESWTETTVETLQFLRDLRAGYRRARLRDSAYVGYVSALAALVYVGPWVVTAVRDPQTQPGEIVPAGVIPGAVAVALLVIVALVRDGMWRGPVLLDPAAAGWLLPLPLRREALLRPRLRVALIAAGVLGATLGAAGGVLLRLLGEGPTGLLALTGATAGGIVLVLGVATSALVETASGTARAALHRAGTTLWLLPVLPPVLAVLTGHERIISTVVLWSGPWGWALQPLVAVLPGRAMATAPWSAWPLALAAALAVTVLVVLAARRRVASVPNRVLRARAATVSAVTQSLGTLQPRRARLLVEAAQGRRPHTGWRLPAPRHRQLLVPWRDATALLRSPTRLIWGLLWLAAAAPLAAASGGVAGWPRFGLALAALAAGYLAVAQLVEGARLDADDPRIVRSLPISTARLAVGHAVTPVLVLVVGCALALPVLTLAGPAGWRPSAVLTLLAAALPALTGAALVSAFRGDVPMGLLAGGASPGGDAGPVLVAVWYVRGPLAALVLLVPFVLGGGAALTAAVPASVMISWAAWQARKVLR